MLLGNIIDLVQKLYNGGPVIRAIMDKAEEIKGKAGQINTANAPILKGAADALKQAANTLKQTPNVANARAFKKEYDAFEKAYNALGEGDSDQSSVKNYWDELKKIIDGANLTVENKKIKFWAIIVPSIVTQWFNFLTYVILLIVYLMGGDTGL